MTHFHGTSILLRSNLRLLPKLVFWGCFVTGLCSGFLVSLSGSDPEVVRIALGVSAVVAVFFGPLCGSSVLFGVQPQTGGNSSYTRREELLTLPIGRLAIPASTLAGGLIFTLSGWSAFVLGVLLLTGPAPFAEVLRELGPEGLGLAASLALFTQLMLTFVASLGAHGVCAAFFLPLLPVGTFVLLPRVGYSWREAGWFLAVCGVILGLYYLVLPFLLYLRPRHLWASSKQDRHAIFDGRLFAWVVVLPVLFVAMGFGLWFLLVLAVAGWKSWRAARARPPVQRQSVSHLRLATLLAVAGLLPVYAVGVVIDACRVAEAGDLARGRVAGSQLSPDGRSLALEVVARDRLDDQKPDEAIRRVHVIDLLGEREPYVLPARFAKLAGSDGRGCWSRDGRYLAVFDQSMGRIKTSSFHGISELLVLTDNPWERLLGVIFNRAASTVIYDTHTGEVSRHDPLQIVPGWERPDELVEVTVGLHGGLVLEDVSGRSLRLPLDGPINQIVGYRDGMPLFESEPHSALEAGDRWLWLGYLGPEGIPVLPLSRWERSGLERWDPTQAPSDWTVWIDFVEIDDPDGDKPLIRSRYALGRGETTHTLEVGSQVLLGPDGEGFALVQTKDDGLERLDLRDGSRAPVAIPGGATALRIKHPAPQGGLFAFRDEDQRWLYVAPEGSIRELPAPAQRPLGWGPAGSLLAWDGHALVRFHADGARQVLAQSVLAQ